MRAANSEAIQPLDLSFVEAHSRDNKDVFFEMNSLTGELGELANVIKKEAFYNEIEEYKKVIDKQISNGRPDFRNQMIDEAGDTFFYFIKVLNKLDITLDEVVKAQKNKLLKQSEKYAKLYRK